MSNPVDFFRFTLNGVNLECYGAAFSQVRGEAAVVTVSTRIPDGALTLNGSGVLTVIFADGTEREIARGTVSGFPVGLSGEEIQVDMYCRNDETIDDQIDAAYDALPEKWQPEPELVPEGAKRRAEGWVPFFVDIDPITHGVSLYHINGKGGYHIFRGDGAAAGSSFIWNIQPSMRADPIRELTAESIAEWQEVGARVIDYGTAAIGQLNTATPDEYKAAVDNVSLFGGGQYLFVGSTLKPSFISATTYPVAVRRAYVDSRTSILHPVIYEGLNVSRFQAPDIDVLTTITQTRRERARVVFTMDHGGFVGRKVSEEYALDGAEERFKSSTSYPIGGEGRRRGRGRVDTYPDSIHYNDFIDGGDWRKVWIPQGILNRSYTQIVDASYCITIRAETTAHHILEMAVGDRCRIEDARLPGGWAEGRVSLVSVVIDESSATGAFEMECSTCAATSNTLEPPVTGGLSVVDTDAAVPTLTQQGQALQGGNPFYFLDAEGEHTNGRWDPYDEEAEAYGLTSQREIVEKINALNVGGVPPIIDPTRTDIPEVYDIRGRAREFLPATTLSLKLRDVGEDESVGKDEHIIPITPIAIAVRKGVEG